MARRTTAVLDLGAPRQPCRGFAARTGVHRPLRVVQPQRWRLLQELLVRLPVRLHGADVAPVAPERPAARQPVLDEIREQLVAEVVQAVVARSLRERLVVDRHHRRVRGRGQPEEQRGVVGRGRRIVLDHRGELGHRDDERRVGRLARSDPHARDRTDSTSGVRLARCPRLG
jgi:hypothetical protein